MSEETQVVLETEDSGGRPSGGRNNWLSAKLASTGIDISYEIDRIRAWASKGAMAILDQGLVSGSNFILSLSLAHWGGPSAYGAYMAVFAVFLLIATVYQALLLEPSTVVAFALFPDQTSRYIRVVLRFHAIFSVAFLLICGTFVVLAPRFHFDPALTNSVAGLLVSAPCVLLFWLARCFAYVEFAPGNAVIGSTLYCVVLTAGLFTSRFLGGLTPFRAFLCTAAGACVASLFLILRYSRGGGAASVNEPSMREVWNRHWDFGRWGLGTVAMAWAQANSISVTSGKFLGLSGIGGVNALVGMLLPMTQVLNSINRIAFTRIAQLFARYGQSAIERPLIRVILAFAGLASAYAVMLILFKNQAFHLLYGDRFMRYAHLLPVVSFHLVAWGCITACDGGFYGIRQPQAPIRLKVVMMVLTILVTTSMSWRFGLEGAAWAIPICSTVTAALMLLKLARVLQANRRADAGVSVS